MALNLVIVIKGKTVDDFINASGEWKSALQKLREICLESGMEETVKWGAPTYTVDGKNIAGIGAFKSYFGLWFFQGALLEDKNKMLVNASEGKTKALRQMRFQSLKEMDAKRIKNYLREAMQNQVQGREIKSEKKPAFEIPLELKKAFSKNAKAKNAFKSLSPYKQREYAEYVSEAKREETKNKRLDKIMPMIEAGISLNDKYRDC